jgi:hypothetical protein
LLFGVGHVCLPCQKCPVSFLSLFPLADNLAPATLPGSSLSDVSRRTGQEGPDPASRRQASDNRDELTRLEPLRDSLERRAVCSFCRQEEPPPAAVAVRPFFLRNRGRSPVRLLGRRFLIHVDHVGILLRCVRHVDDVRARRVWFVETRRPLFGRHCRIRSSGRCRFLGFRRRGTGHRGVDFVCFHCFFSAQDSGTLASLSGRQPPVVPLVRAPHLFSLQAGWTPGTPAQRRSLGRPATTGLSYSIRQPGNRTARRTLLVPGLPAPG